MEFSFAQVKWLGFAFALPFASVRAQTIDPGHLIEVIKSGNFSALNVSSVDDFILRLPAAVQSTGVIVYDTIGDQSGSLRHPRLERVSAEHSLFVAVGLDPKRRGYNTVELSWYPKKGGPRAQALLEFSGGKGTAKLNPENCVKCHAGNRAIWVSDTVNPFHFGRNVGRLSHIPEEVEVAMLDKIRQQFRGDPRFTGLDRDIVHLRDSLTVYEGTMLARHFDARFHEVNSLVDGPKLVALFRELAKTDADTSFAEIARTAKKFGFAIDISAVHANADRLEELLSQKNAKTFLSKDLAPYLLSNSEAPSPSWEQARVKALAGFDLLLKARGHPGLESWSTTFNRPSLGFSGRHEIASYLDEAFGGAGLAAEACGFERLAHQKN